MSKNIVQRLGSAAEKAILSRIKSSSLYAEYYKRGEKGAPWKREPTAYKRKEIKDWTNAVMAATDPDNPRRGELGRFYKSLMLDPHLASVIDTRYLRVQRSSYKIVNEKGEENEALKELLERPWHDDLIRLTLGRNFQGTTLIEMFYTDSDTGELAQVDQIPQSNFIAQKGIIVEDEYDDKGTSYREGRYKDFYIQVGNDWELGMLNELAMVVLAKKLGLGSWIGYIEKLGIPPIFAITERMDDTRRDELFNMLSDFKSNHFAVLQGNEKIETPSITTNNAHLSFSSLITDICNTEMSKRVLGGTATTDEKSFVGSAEVQERVAQDRYEADKLLYKHYFNTQFRQRLAKLSSVYADFATHKLVWDNQETLDINGYIDAVQKLSTAFDFDIEEVKSRTGLPITGMRSLATPTQTEDTDPQKKKLEARFKQLGNAPYAFVPNAFELFAATWDAAIERLANQIYNGEVKSTDLDNDLVLKNYAAFNKEGEKAWGKGYYDEPLTRSFRENFLKFAGAKSHDLMKQLDGLNSGNISKDDFIAKAKGIVQKHNAAYLTTELRFCNSSVHAAQDYQTYLDDVDIYQNLKCRTMADKDVRDSHAKNEGIVKPVREWKSLPPFDDNCRCWLEQTLEEPTVGRHLTGLKYHNNPHNTGIVFNDERSYFQNMSDDKRAVIKDNTEMMKRFMPYNTTIKAGDNKVFVNDFSDPVDTVASINAAKKIAKELKKDVYVLSHVENSGKLHVKNPELGIGSAKVLGDLKTFKPKVNGKEVKLTNHIDNRTSSASKQGCKYVVYDLSACPENTFKSDFLRKIHGVIVPGRKKSIEQVVVIRGDKVVKLSRKQIYNQDYKAFESEFDIKASKLKARTIAEAEEIAKGLGVKKVDFGDVSLSEANTLLEALNENVAPTKSKKTTLDELIIKPKLKGDSTKNGIVGGYYYNDIQNEKRSIYLNSSMFRTNHYKKPMGYDEQVKRMNDKVAFTERSIENMKKKLGESPTKDKRLKREIKQEERRISDYEWQIGRLNQKIKNGESPLPNTTTQLFKEQSDQIKSLLHHEYGHHVDTNMRKEFSGEKEASIYGSKSSTENFAEWYTLYRMNGSKNVPDDLLKIFKDWEDK